MIRRIETTTSKIDSTKESGQEQSATLQAMEQQRQSILASLRNHAASGRLVIRITSDIDAWVNTPADIEMRSGDVLTIPKRPSFVIVSGQVYNSTAISFAPGKDAAWYLKGAGGATDSANQKAIFVVRADGSVVGRGQSSGLFWKGEGGLSTRMQPGDSIVVPEKIKGGSAFWKEALGAGQIFTAIGLTAAVALK
jgi:protein involved in polysaccharide export with SLBB domain